MRLSEHMTGRENNLNLVRFLAATIVVYAHASGADRRGASEIVRVTVGAGLGDIGVYIFFFVSGLLIAKSWQSRSNLIDFWWARIKRIFPALWVSNVLFVAVFGAFFVNLSWSAYLTHPLTLSYLLENSTMLPGTGAQSFLPGVFGAAKQEVNLPLWTLPHELQMYALLSLLGVVGLAGRAWITLVISLGAFALALLSVAGVFDTISVGRLRFVFLFFAGASAYNLRNSVPLDGRLALGAIVLVAFACLFVHPPLLRQFALLAAIPVVTLWLAYVPDGGIRRFNQIGDYSYGIYIFAFPVQLVLAKWLVGTAQVVQFAAAMAVVLPLAALSWHGLEQRALRLPVPALLRRWSSR